MSSYTAARTSGCTNSSGRPSSRMSARRAHRPPRPPPRRRCPLSAAAARATVASGSSTAVARTSALASSGSRRSRSAARETVSGRSSLASAIAAAPVGATPSAASEPRAHEQERVAARRRRDRPAEGFARHRPIARCQHRRDSRFAERREPEHVHAGGGVAERREHDQSAPGSASPRATAPGSAAPRAGGRCRRPSAATPGRPTGRHPPRAAAGSAPRCSRSASRGREGPRRGPRRAPSSARPRLQIGPAARAGRRRTGGPRGLPWGSWRAPERGAGARQRTGSPARTPTAGGEDGRPRAAGAVGQGPEQARLADPGRALHERHSSDAAGRGVDQTVEHDELVVALEQSTSRHVRILGAAGGPGQRQSSWCQPRCGAAAAARRCVP